MSKSKYMDAICAAAAIIMVIVTVVILGGGGTFLQAAAAELPYVDKLFSTDSVHTVDIVADDSDWEQMLENATAEEYISCTVVIDGESYKNVAIRPKGNSSLTTVSSSDSDRYSFKIEFDHYDNNTTYYGLDKLCLNNIIQDNTYMKDFLSYDMMNQLGADAPLSSFVWITVNGEDWGLYLAVEGIEEAYAQREYGTDHGEIYKPDSMDMGGGGRGAEARNKDENTEQTGGFGGMDMDSLLSELKDENGDYPEAVQEIIDEIEGGTLSLPGDLQTILDRLEEAGVTLPDELQQMAQMFTRFAQRDNTGTTDDTAQAEGDAARQEPPAMPDGEAADGTGETEGPPALPDGETGDTAAPEIPDDTGGMGGGMAGDVGMGGSEDVLLVYSDDNVDSYPNIFDNAVFDTVTESDQERLIEALKKLNEGDIEGSVNIDEVLRYFAVHNFVLNGDSYTGSIIHNYYLYEEDGLLSMIAWDYNLAFGGMGSSGMGGGGATSTVNSPIDSPVSSGDIEDRPMVAWIFSSDEYTQMYHEVMGEFISSYFTSGYFEELIDRVSEMIAPYVEKDPTAFCTYEEFLTGVETLKEFCLLRAESVEGQLAGEIPSTSEGQSEDSSTLIDASHINVSDMGSQGGNMGGGDTAGRGGFGGFDTTGETGGETAGAEIVVPDGEQAAGEEAQSGEALEAAAGEEKSAAGEGDAAAGEETTGEQAAEGETQSGEALEATAGEEFFAEAPTTGRGAGGMGGQMPSGEMPSGEMPTMPDGTVPEGTMPEGEAPAGEMPDGAAQEGTVPEGAAEGETAGESAAGEESQGEGGVTQEAPAAGETQQDAAQGTAPDAAQGGGMQFGGGNMDFGAGTATASGSMEGWLLLGGSILVLIVGIVIAKIYR